MANAKVWTYFGDSPAMLEDMVQGLIDRGGKVLSLAISYGPSPAKAAGAPHGSDTWTAMVIVDTTNIDPDA